MAKILGKIMDKKEAIENVIKIFAEVKKTDDEVVKSAESLKIVLLNLKIEGAKIKESNGIKPIANRLENDIDNIETNVKNLVEKSRDVLTESIRTLAEGIL